MSAIKQTFLYCDGGDKCPRQDGNQEPFRAEFYSGDNAQNQRRDAKLLGWTYTGGKDYCSACSKRLRTQR